jgi:UDP-glucose 4-epimerase
MKAIKIPKMASSVFAGNTLLITGGTGSFGNAVLRRFLKTDIQQIRIFSRDEKKQDDMGMRAKQPAQKRRARTDR